MEAAQPRGRRGRSRRRTVDKPLDTRLVRAAAFVVVPAVLALLLSISTPGPLPRPTVEPLFDAGSAVALATQLTAAYPSRIPGSVEAGHAAAWYEQTISSLGLSTEQHAWRESLPGLGDVELRNIVTVIRGRSDATIVVVAYRDNLGAGKPLGDNASGTAALLELARGYGKQGTVPPPVPQRTLVLVSTDAGAYGGAGAVRFADYSEHAGIALAAIVLDGLGGGGKPRIALSAGAVASPARVLVATAESRIAEHVGAVPALPSAASQLVALGIPFAAGEQGAFLARGIAALAITRKEVGDPDVPSGDPETELRAERLGELGRAAEAIVESIDASVRSGFGTPDAVFLETRIVSGWAVRLLLVIAVAPFAIGVVDLLARGRRRRLAYGPAARALGIRLLLWLYGGLLLMVGAATEVLPTGAPLPFPPSSEALGGWPAAGVALLAAAFGLGWIVARGRLAPAHPVIEEERLAGSTVALAWLAILAVVIGIGRPYALVFVLPSLYAWLWLPLQSAAWARVVLFALGLLGPAAGLAVLADGLGLGLLDTLRYVVGLASVGYVSAGSVLLAIGWLAAAGQLGAVAFGRYASPAARAAPQRYASGR